MNINNRKISDHINNIKHLKKSELISILDSGNYNPNIKDSDGFGLLFHFAEFSEYKLLKKLIKHPDIDLSLNADQVIAILLNSNKHKLLTFFLNENKQIIQEQYKTYFFDMFIEDFETNLKFNKKEYLKGVLIYLSIIEEKIPLDNINPFVKKVKLKILTFQKLLEKLDLIN